MASKKKYITGGSSGPSGQGSRYNQPSYYSSGAPPGSTALSGGPFASRFAQAPVPQRLIGQSKLHLPPGYPIGPSSRQGMGSRLGDSSSLGDQIQQLQKFKGSFNPVNNQNNQFAVRPPGGKGGPSPAARTNRSSGAGVYDETNVPITERSHGQGMKSARHEPKTLAQMKPNLLANDYAMQPDEPSGYSTGAFKTNPYADQNNTYQSVQPAEDQSRQYASEIHEIQDNPANRSQSSAYAAENQIQFQGDLGEDMFPPCTDDDDSQDDRQEQVAAKRFKESPAQPRDWVRLSEKEDDTPQILANHRKLAANINPNAFQSRGNEKRAAQTANHNMMTFNELSELEISQSQIQVDGQSDRGRDAQDDRHHSKDQEQRDGEQTDNSEAASAHALYHPQDSGTRRSKNTVDTANMMYTLKSGPKGKGAGHSRQRQLQTMADMSGYEGDQDQYRGQSRGRFYGGKIESRKKKKVSQQLVAARNASKKYRDTQQLSGQDMKASQKREAAKVPQSQIELTLDDPIGGPQEDSSRQVADRQQTGISGISGMSALSGISGASALSGVGFQIGEKPSYQSIPQNLKPQTQIVDIQVQPSSASLPKSQKSYATAGNNEPSGSEGYQTRPQLYEEEGLRIEHDTKPEESGEAPAQGLAEKAGRAYPRPRAPVKIVDISEGADPTVAKPQHPGSAKSQVDEAREALEKMDPEQRKRLETQSAVKIQKWVRGHIARTTARKQKEINFRQMRKLRRMLSVAYGKTRTKLLKQLVHVLKESGNLHCDQNYQLWKKYQAHCATLIQRHWRGYSVRFLHIEKFNEKAWQHKQSRLLSALVKGYKTRLLLHPDGYHQGIHRVRLDILRVANQDNGKALIIDVNDRLTLKNLMKRRRQKVIELIRLFNKASQTQGIILHLLQQKGKLESQDPIGHLSERTTFAAASRTGNSTKMLSDPQSSQKSLKNVSTLLDYGSGNRRSKVTKQKQPVKARGGDKNAARNQQIGDEFRGSFQNKGHKLKNPLGRAAADGEYSGSRHGGSSSPVQENEAGEAESSGDDGGQRSGTLWPSRVSKQKPEKSSSQLAAMWPSAQQSKATEDTESGEAKGGFASFWPSVKQETKKQMDKKDVVLEERDDGDSGESGDVDWLALPVAKPKDQHHPEGEKSFEDEARRQRKSAEKPGAKSSKADGAGTRPARPFDEEPVGIHNWQPDPDQEKPQVASFGVRGVSSRQQEEVTAVDDLPIKPLAEPYGVESLAIGKQRSSNISDARSNASGAQMGYDFEKMIEVAMQKFGEAPAVMAPEKPDKSGGMSGPGAAAVNSENAQDKSQRRDKDDREIKVDDKKKELLQKRKKYDPRAAIKKSKQQEAAATPHPDHPGEAADTQIMSSRNAADKLGRTAGTKSISDLPDEEIQPGAVPNEEQNDSQLPQHPPRPYLKRKTKAVKVEKGNQYKVEGKSRIDCWQKGDKDGNGNVVVYGNKRRKRQSLLKKNQESRSKIGWSNEGSPSPGQRRQPGDRSSGTSPAPFRMNQPRFNLNQADTDALGAGDEQYMAGRDPDHPEMIGGTDAFMNQSRMAYQNYNDPHQQYTNTLLPSSHLSNHLPVQDLETQFDLLHGPNQEQYKLEAPPAQPDAAGAAGISSMDRAAQRLREKQMADVRKEINSHEFKYSMIPFSAFNNSQEVNLYKPQSRIPFLFKDTIPAVQKSPDFQNPHQAPSLFFKCYSDDLYEAILEDYRSHYVAISNQDLDDDDDDEGEVDGDEYEEA